MPTTRKPPALPTPECELRFDDAAAYERLMGRWSRAAGSVFLDWLAPSADGCWLDVGCGTGVLTDLIVGSRSPAAVFAVDPAEAQIAHARRALQGQRAEFRVADAQALPFTDSMFDIVVSALVVNFIPDRLRALAEMRRVARLGAIVAGYVWDFAAERSPSWPLRQAMHQVGLTVAGVSGTPDSSLGALQSLFTRAGFENIATLSIDVAGSYTGFDDFWEAQTPRYSPLTQTIAALTNGERSRLIEATRAALPICADGRIEYSARATAIKAHVPA